MQVSQAVIDVVKYDIESLKTRKENLQKQLQHMRRELQQHCEYLNSVTSKLAELENFIVANG